MKPISPKNYELSFEPDFKNFKFAGKEKVVLEIAKPTDVLVLNAAEIEVKECHVFCKGKTLNASAKLDEKKEELAIKIPEKVGGRVELFIDFAGTLNDRLIGFYRSEYNDQQGRKKFLATTQFEAADARRAFPCWDEPEAKATFEVSVLVDKNLSAISNMPVAAKKNIKDKILFRFDRTPIMSTYLLYIGVGEFEFLEDKLGKILIRVVTTKGKSEQGKLAIEYAKKFLEFYESYFGIRYPLPKLDLIALPDFTSGAMENWGSITFRESALLYDSKNSSTATKQRIAETIAHELAHQWFGNLVTMKWWNDLWLNESFATFMATKAVDKFYPEWDFWDQFLGSSTSEAFALDALKSSHPIEVEVKKPSEIREIFDDISYDKGGNVLRMLESFIGESAFQEGLKNYLTSHKYGNATTEDLWNSFAAVSKQPVKEMMDSWVKQVGYPLVEAHAKGSRVELAQKRFLIEGEGSAREWMIPISVKTFDSVVHRMMDKKTLEIPLETTNTWFKVNFAQKGFYRVRYDKHSLDLLRHVVLRKELGNFDRWGIQNDLFALALAGKASLGEYLDFAGCYFEDGDYLVSDDIATNLYFVYLISSGERFWGRIKEFNAEYFRKVFGRLGWDAEPGEKETNKLLRSFVISALGRLDEKDILSEAKYRFDKFLDKPEQLDPDLRSVVYTLVAWSGDEKIFDQLANLYRKAPTQEEKIRFLAALAGFKDEGLLLKSLDFSISPEVRSQDMFITIARVAGNPYGRKIVWSWLKKNWGEIMKKFGYGSPLLNRIIGSISVMADASKEDEIKSFFKKNPVPGTERKIAQTLESLRINAKFLERMRQEFSA